MSDPLTRPGGLAVLIIEDDPVLGPALLQRLRLEGHQPRLVTDGAQALAFVASRRPDVILSDIRLPDMNGERIWRQTLETAGPVPAYFMTAYGEVEQAVRLVKGGARDYLTKPVDVEALVRALHDISRAVPATTPDEAGELGASPAMRALAAQLVKAARSDLPILIGGETGAGKEIAARFVHARSPRARGPFVVLNCAAIPRDLAESLLFGHEKGAFTGAHARQVGAAEEAAGGTLFLDEIAELPLDLQAKLLRLIEARSFRPLGARADLSFDARVISASHADLAERVAARAFREDLYFRLNVIHLAVPPLRERPGDVLALAGRFLAEAAGRQHARGSVSPGLDAEAQAALLAHDWPGNVRELRNRIERAVALAEGPVLTVDDLFPEATLDRPAPSPTGEDSDLQDAAREAIRARVEAALKATGGNRSEAARLLGVSRTTIWKYSR
jgi:DNA-binding NtrC family response regulator